MILVPKNWLAEVIPFVDDHGFTFVGSMTQLHRLQNPDWSKIILYNWDHYAHINYSRPDWVAFHEACKKACEVWMPTQAHADYYEAFSGIKSHVLNIAFVIPSEFEGENTAGDYAMMSSRDDGYKRFPLFSEACRRAGIPCVKTHPATTPRADYIKLLKGCRVYVQASLDESLGGLSLMEAVWCGKPVIMSETIKGGKEIYGDTIVYFSDEDDLKHKILTIEPQPRARSKIESQTPEQVGKKITERLLHLHEEVSRRN